jgi:hypothetical protein
MRLRRPPDGKLTRLSDLTGASARDVLALARAVELLEAPSGQDVLVEWTGASHVVAVLDGRCLHVGGRVMHMRSTGDVFRTDPGDRVVSRGVTLAVAAPSHIGLLRQACRPPAARVDTLVPVAASAGRHLPWSRPQRLTP